MKQLLRTLALLALLFALLVLSSCTNPDAPSATTRTASGISPQNAGEPPVPPPPSSSTQTPIGVQATPTATLEAFAQLYINWTYHTLTSNQRRLAAMSIGPARLAEQQAVAASRADTTIARSHIHNTGQIVSIAPEHSHTGTWVIVTREQTGGSSEYQGLGAAYHVTLAKLAHIKDGYSVESWLPQS